MCEKLKQEEQNFLTPKSVEDFKKYVPSNMFMRDANYRNYLKTGGGFKGEKVNGEIAEKAEKETAEILTLWFKQIFPNEVWNFLQKTPEYVDFVKKMDFFLYFPEKIKGEIVKIENYQESIQGNMVMGVDVTTSMTINKKLNEIRSNFYENKFCSTKYFHLSSQDSSKDFMAKIENFPRFIFVWPTSILNSSSKEIIRLKELIVLVSFFEQILLQLKSFLKVVESKKQKIFLNDFEKNFTNIYEKMKSKINKEYFQKTKKLLNETSEFKKLISDLDDIFKDKFDEENLLDTLHSLL